MSFGLKMPVTVLQGTILDFAITTLPNNTRAMDHTVERAKVLIGLFDHPSHGIDIRHTRVRIQNFTTKRLDSFDCPDSPLDRIISLVSSDPGFPGFSIRQAGSPHEHQARFIVSGEVFRNRHADLTQSAGDQVYASFPES